MLRHTSAVSTEAAAAPVPTVREPGFGRRMRWVTILYFAQGFPFGIFREIWAVFFRQRGVSLTEIGMMELLGLPWVSDTPCWRSEEHTSELQSQSNLVCRLLLEKKKK